MQPALRGGNTRPSEPQHHGNGRAGGGVSLQGWRKDFAQNNAAEAHGSQGLLLPLPSWGGGGTCQSPVNPLPVLPAERLVRCSEDEEQGRALWLRTQPPAVSG